MTTPSMTLWAILQTRASSPSPTYDAPRGANTSISGVAVLQAASGPERTAESLPALITLALPLTGAATKSAPSCLSLSRMAADSSTAMVEQSTTIGGILPPWLHTPFLPYSTSCTSEPVATIENNTSTSFSSDR